MRRLACGLALAATTAGGCLTYGSLRNAPGHVDLGTWPAEPSAAELPEPTDPGQHVLFLAAGPSGTLGGGAGRNAAATLGASAQLGYTRLSRSYPVPAGWSGAPAGRIGLLDRELAAGLRAGWTGWAEGGGPDRLFVEASGGASFLEAGLGWCWEPSGAASGPQASLYLGPLFLRGWAPGAGGAVALVGLDVQASLALVWRR